MGNSNQDLLALIGRIVLALMFVMAGFDKLTGFDGTTGYIASQGLPMPAVLAALALIVEIGAGLAVIVGFRTRWAALLLALFTVLASVVFHNFWAVPAEQKMVQMLFFMKNLSVIGGMLVLAAFGAGRWSLDGRKGG